jgi:hypothetical protein
MVIIYEPTISSQVYTVDTSAPSPLPTSTTSSPYNSPQLPTSAPLIFPEPDSAVSGGPPPRAFHNQWGDPNNRSNSEGLASPNTGGPREKEEERKGRKHRRRRRSSTCSRYSIQENEPKRPGLVRTVKGMINGPGKEEQRFLKRLKGMDMQKVCRHVWWKLLC